MSGLLVQPVIPQEAPGELPCISSQHAHIREGGFSISVKWSTARLLSGATHTARLQGEGEAKCGQVLPWLSALSLRGVCRQGWRQLHQLSVHGSFGA